MKPKLDNLKFRYIGEDNTQWLERESELKEIRAVVFNLGRDKAPWSDGFPMAIFLKVLGCG